MKRGFLAALMLLAACAPPQTSRPGASRSTGTPAPGETRTTNTVSQDAAECERQAAISASAGNRAQALNDCMKARGRTPGR
jgi:hypothetical protein